jgi:hypothetical protein
MELEPAARRLRIVADRRPHLDEPLPVKLVAVADVSLPAPAGLQDRLDAFYCGLLEFQRDPAESGLVYRADNFRLRFDVIEGAGIERDDLRATGIVIQSMADIEKKLIDTEIQYSRQRGLLPGQEVLVLLDPAGNWLELSEVRQIG